MKKLKKKLTKLDKCEKSTNKQKHKHMGKKSIGQSCYMWKEEKEE